MDKDRQYTWWIKAISGADEVQARRFAAAIALEMGHGGVSRVVELTGMSHLTIDKGIKELKETEKLEVPERLRSPGGGRKRIEDKD
ncbi:MAG: ISAzo13 family transposase, partial [Thermoplasmataceae archaeon]